MKAKWGIWAIGLIGLAATADLRGQAAPPSGPIDYETLAQRIVGQCASIKEGEVVSISGNVRDMELLEDLTVHTRKLGAFPLLSVGSDRLARRLLVDVPEKYDTQAPRLDLKLAEIVDVQLSVDWGSDPAMNADISSQRFEARNQAYTPVNAIYVNRVVRSVSLGNGMYPSIYNATQFGISQAELSTLFWDAVNIDYASLQTIGNTVGQKLAQGREVRITNPNGTDLRVQIAGRPVIVSDGVFSADDVSRGYASAQIYLPAGEVFLAPVPGTAEGKIVIDRLWYFGKEINGMTLSFKAGKLTGMTGQPGYEAIQARYDVAGSGKDEFAYIDVGINPKMKIPAGSKFQNWVVSGMVTVGIGDNVWAGGANNCSYGLSGYLPGSTLTIDGKPVVESGNLKL